MDSDGSGCVDHAASEVFGNGDGRRGLPGWQQLVTIDGDSYSEMLTNRAVKDAERAWSDCMGSKGFRYDDPQGPLADFGFDASDRTLLTKPPSAKEIAVAVADVKCRDSSHLEDTYFAIESQIQLEALQKIPDIVSEFSTSMSEATKRALRITSSN